MNHSLTLLILKQFALLFILSFHKTSFTKQIYIIFFIIPNVKREAVAVFSRETKI